MGFFRNNHSMHASPNLVVRLRRSLTVFLMLLFCGSAGASENPQPAINAGDNAWMLVCTALVLMMTAPGLILFYGGLVRRKNVLATMMHSLILMALASFLWMAVGYSIAFADGNAFFGNPLQYFFLGGVGVEPNTTYAATIPHQTFMLFQMMFAIITPALISESTTLCGIMGSEGYPLRFPR